VHYTPDLLANSSNPENDTLEVLSLHRISHDFVRIIEEPPDRFYVLVSLNFMGVEKFTFKVSDETNTVEGTATIQIGH